MVEPAGAHGQDVRREGVETRHARHGLIHVFHRSGNSAPRFRQCYGIGFSFAPGAFNHPCMAQVWHVAKTASRIQSYGNEEGSSSHGGNGKDANVLQHAARPQDEGSGVEGEEVQGLIYFQSSIVIWKYHKKSIVFCSGCIAT